MTLSAASDRIRKRTVSAVELTAQCLDSITSFDGVIHAWVRVCGDEALEHAKALDQLLMAGTHLGPLHGIPVGIKDIYDVAGVPTEAGSSLRHGIVPTDDAETVRRLKHAGAVVLGKTVTTELGHSVPRATRNPWNIEHTPGGSSSGSAAAVAARMCFGAVGSQTLGSIIRPASYCGIVGIKPTIGLINKTGILPLAPTLDTPGAMALTVNDVRILLGVMSGTGNDIAVRQGGPENIGVGISGAYFDLPDPISEQCFEQAVCALRDLGMRVVEVPLGQIFEALASAAQIVTHAEVAALHIDLMHERGDEYSGIFRRNIERGLMIPAAAYIRAQQIRARALTEIRELFATHKIDVIAAPAATGPAPVGLNATGDARFNTPFTALGLPAVTVPMGFIRGLPIGLQMAGLPFSEHKLLAVAEAYEQLTEWWKQVPPLLVERQEGERVTAKS